MPISIQYKTVELPAPFPILERFERVPVHYEWTGTDALVLVMDYPNAKVGDYIEVGPYVGRIVERDYAMRSWRIVRCDMYGDFLALVWPLRVWLLEVNYRILATLAVWGLCHPKSNYQLSWRDVGIKRKVA